MSQNLSSAAVVNGALRVNYKKKGPRTVLMKDCPLKRPEKSFKENDIFSMKKIVGFNPRLIHKSSFLIGQVPIENMG